ncbi:uncharacterized protein L3040_003346 [Drepanopeziza brunnea f. sp. 'multigermtubi']|uniref:uncharacterized protein n=1 Tax=Drepanopeziza brunnea f. sp. 'multigermtubi' TaxID=698441 RepID=UPI0023A34C93|nr:hypothetical protein L3040_003346 [Drepanopeziza brunnea f. sp. 'multigermtubi']
MHLQTQTAGGTITTTFTTTTTTAQMATSKAYSSIPLPASPTLTNPDMILPYGEYDFGQPASSGEDWDDDSRQANMHTSMGKMASTTPIIYGNGTMLSDIGEVTEAESTLGKNTSSRLPGPAERRLLKQQQQASGNSTPMRSSPTIGYAAVMKRTQTGTHKKRVSVDSASTITSEGRTAELFQDFDDDISVDDSVFQGDDEESVADSHTEQVIASETKRLATRDSEFHSEEDRNSSAALSRRAEQILSNAKKRLNNMEGNLTRARSTLYVTRSGSGSSIHSSSPLSRSTPSPQNDKLATPSKQRPSPTSAQAVSLGHARRGSENSTLSSQRIALFRIPIPVRSASAAAQLAGRSDLNRRSPQPSSGTQTIREDTGTPSHSGYASSLSKSSPTHATLEPLNEHEDRVDFDADRESIRSSVDTYVGSNGEHRGLTRTASSAQMRELKDQMSDLKGRLSALRDRARDDTMKRRSMQSLRIPSPFTAAEQWYASSKNYGDPLGADAGVASPPWKGSETGDAEAKHDFVIDGTPRDMPDDSTASDITSIYEDVNEHQSTYEPEQNRDLGSPETMVGSYANGDEDLDRGIGDDGNGEMLDHEEEDEYESDASLYQDSQSTPLSHEDREDAFDYEHFFLHSALGTISQQRMERRGSFNSEDSVETVQAVPISASPARKTLGTHFRTESSDSVSTSASFITATEGNKSENGDYYEDQEEKVEPNRFAVQRVTALPAHSITSTSLATERLTYGSDTMTRSDDPNSFIIDPTTRSSSAGHDRSQRNASKPHHPSAGSFESFVSNGTSRSFPLVNKSKSQQISVSSAPTLGSLMQASPSILSDSMTSADTTNGERRQPSPVHMLAREDQALVERLVASLGRCVLELHEAGRASYEGRVWRRRLDAAIRVLEGDGSAT